MNICFVYKLYPVDGNYDSGIGKYLADMTSELVKKHKVVILTTSIKPRVIKSKNLVIYAIQYPKNNRKTLSFIKHLCNVAILLPKIIKKHKIEIIEFPNWECEGFLFTFFSNRLLKIPVVVRLHTPSKIINGYQYSKKTLSNFIVEHIENIFINQKTNYLTSSTVSNKKMSRKIYRTNKTVTLIPLGVRTKKIMDHSEGVRSRTITILYIGRLEFRKGIDILLSAMPKVLSNFKNIRFVIVGRENDNLEWLIKLRNSIQYRHLSKINFLGYINDQAVIDNLYQDSDICVFPSRYESFGLTVLEAMSFGKPVVATRVGGIPEIIEDGVGGILVKPDSGDLAKNIIELVKNPKLMHAIGKGGLLIIRKKFSVKNMVENTISYYSSIISKGNSSQT